MYVDFCDCYGWCMDVVFEGFVEVVIDEVDEMEKYWFDWIDGVFIWDFFC